MTVGKAPNGHQPDPSLFRQYLGLARSYVMYYGHPLRNRRLARLYAEFIQPGGLCFDIGAHLGSHLHIWSLLGAHVVAVEPQPQCMRLLRRWYGRHPRVTLLEQAVGAQSGIQPLFISQRTPTVSTLSRDWINTIRPDPGFANVRWDLSIKVRVTTLDALIAQYGAPTFCKIDVEGAEIEVLRGLSSPLRSLSFEYITPAMERAVQCIERLEELGRYEYNWSPREGDPLQSPIWLTPVQTMDRLHRLCEQGGSGDVYARLCA